MPHAVLVKSSGTLHIDLAQKPLAGRVEVGMTARFVRRENVKHYRHLLETETDEAERQKILKLLAEEAAFRA
jgi:hypothetical protein